MCVFYRWIASYIEHLREVEQTAQDSHQDTVEDSNQNNAIPPPQDPPEPYQIFEKVQRHSEGGVASEPPVSECPSVPPPGPVTDVGTGQAPAPNSEPHQPESVNEETVEHRFR